VNAAGDSFKRMNSTVPAAVSLDLFDSFGFLNYHLFPDFMGWNDELSDLFFALPCKLSCGINSLKEASF
jgi:hypothetical protein